MALGPVAEAPARVKDIYRYQLTLKAKNRKTLQADPKSEKPKNSARIACGLARKNYRPLFIFSTLVYHIRVEVVILWL